MRFKSILGFSFWWLIFLSGAIGERLVYAEAPAPAVKTPGQIIEQEIQQHDNSPALQQLWERIINESNAVKQLELILATLKLLHKEKQPYIWAFLHGIAGNALSHLNDLNRAENLEQAIAHYQQALTVFTRQAFPEEWAMTQNNLANAYWKRIRSKRADNLEQAIEHYQQALTVFTRQAFPEDWAMTQNNLAIAYSDRLRGERADNLEQAIEHYQQVLEVRTRQAFPEWWAETQHNLATVYSNRIRGERADNLEQAIEHFQQALEVRTRQAFPEKWAMSQNNLASAYCKRLRGERANNLEQAIEHFQRALTVFTRQAFPRQWAAIQNNLAVAYGDRLRSERADNLEQAIKHSQQALTVHTHQAFPEQWADTQNNLASAYLDRIRGERADNLEQAIEHYQQALEVHTRQAFPEGWAMTQNNLALAYSDRLRGERADNLERAIEYYQQALTVFTRQAFPEKWAMTRNNLATAYWERIRGEQADNLEQAIEYYQQALEVRTRQAFPEQWADTQNNLANVYWKRIRGKRTDNLERAIEHYQQALTVFTRQAFPEKWAMTQNNLATAYSYRIRGEQADNLEQAIKHYQQALEVRTRQAFPEGWAKIQNNLAITYSVRIRGERADNLEQAIEHYQQALTVYTRQAFPEQWAETQNNLAIAYSDRIRGERADNLEQAIEHFQQALEVYTHEAFPENFMISTDGLSKILLTTQQYSIALTHLEATLQTNETLLQQISFTPAERQRLVKNAETLFANAVWAAVQSGAYVKAARFLEWGKTRLLRQNLALDTVHLQALPTAEQTQLQQLQSIVTNLEIQLQDPQQTDSAILSQLRADLKQQRQQLRQQLQHSGVTATQAPKSKAINQWLQALPAKSVLIAPVFTDFGTVVFLMPAGNTRIDAQQVLILPEFSRQDLQTITRGAEENRSGGYLEVYWQWTAETDKNKREWKRQLWQLYLIVALEQLRTALLEPIFTRLSALKVQPGAHLFWLPDSDSSILPIHAISIAKQPVLSRYTVHFIPSLYSGYTAQQRLLSQTPTDHTNQLLALINPTENLAYAPIEGEIVSHFFAAAARTILQGTAGTHIQLKQALANHPLYLHFSTHGRYDWSNPLESGLALANKAHWTLSDLLTETDLSGSRLAVLSACETGLTDIGMPTEALGLPAGFLQAGIPGVISTLWTVNDLSTTLLLEKFYELHLTKGIEPAKALGQAQAWLRTVTNLYLKNWLSSQATRRYLKESVSPQSFREGLERLTKLRMMNQKDLANQPYSEPYYWAGFIYTGV